MLVVIVAIRPPLLPHVKRLTLFPPPLSRPVAVILFAILASSISLRHAGHLEGRESCNAAVIAAPRVQLFFVPLLLQSLQRLQKGLLLQFLLMLPLVLPRFLLSLHSPILLPRQPLCHHRGRCRCRLKCQSCPSFSSSYGGRICDHDAPVILTLVIGPVGHGNGIGSGSNGHSLTRLGGGGGR